MNFDPTAFMRVNNQAPSSPLAAQIIGAHQAGLKNRTAAQDAGLRERAMQVTEQRAQRESEDYEYTQQMRGRLDELGKRLLTASKTNDSDGYAATMNEIATISPQTAQQMDAVFNTSRKQRRVEAAYRLLAASAMPAERVGAQNKVLSQAADIVGQDDVFHQGLVDIQSMPAGKERTKALLSAVQVAKNLGYFPERKAGKTAEQIERELVTKEQGVSLRKGELAAREEQEQWERAQLSESNQERYDTYITQGQEAESKARLLDNVIKRVSKNPSRLGGGAYARLLEQFKSWTGKGDETTALRKTVEQIRVQEGISGLPKGPASDKDIALVLGPLPTSFDNPKVLQPWLKGMLKAHVINSAFATYKAKHIQKARSLDGFIDAWEKDRDSVITHALKKYGLKLEPDKGDTIDTGEDVLPVRKAKSAKLLEVDVNAPVVGRLKVNERGELE